MFDLPVRGRLNINETLTTSTASRIRFRELELEELERAQAGSEDFKYLQPLKSHSIEGATIYRGLGTMGTYAQTEKDGNFEFQSIQEFNSFPIKDEVTFITAKAREEHNTAQTFRTMNPPQVRQTGDKFNALKKKLSLRAQRIMDRGNVAGQKYLIHDTTDDLYYKRSTKDRLLYMATSILHVSMMQKDYNQAYKAFTLLLRHGQFNLRELYGVATELMAWKTGKTAIQFSLWAAVAIQWSTATEGAFNYDRIHDPFWLRTRAMLSQTVESIKQHQGIEQAVERLKNDLSVTPASTLAANHGILGALAIELEQWDLAGSCFSKCQKLGGIVPAYYTELLKVHTGTEFDSTDPLTVTYGYKVHGPKKSQKRTVVKSVPEELDSDTEQQAGSEPEHEQGEPEQQVESESEHESEHEVEEDGDASEENPNLSDNQGNKSDEAGNGTRTQEPYVPTSAQLPVDDDDDEGVRKDAASPPAAYPDALTASSEELDSDRDSESNSTSASSETTNSGSDSDQSPSDNEEPRENETNDQVLELESTVSGQKLNYSSSSSDDEEAPAAHLDELNSEPPELVRVSLRNEIDASSFSLDSSPTPRSKKRQLPSFLQTHLAPPAKRAVGDEKLPTNWLANLNQKSPEL